MRARVYGALLLVGGLAACGSSSSTGLRVSCEHGASVQPLERLQVRVRPATPQAAASAEIVYKDPLNKSETATLRIEAGDSCTVGPAGKV